MSEKEKAPELSEAEAEKLAEMFAERISAGLTNKLKSLVATDEWNKAARKGDFAGDYIFIPWAMQIYVDADPADLEKCVSVCRDGGTTHRELFYWLENSLPMLANALIKLPIEKRFFASKTQGYYRRLESEPDPCCTHNIVTRAIGAATEIMNEWRAKQSKPAGN